MSRERRVHEVILPRRTCGAFLTGFIWNIQTTRDPEQVTCLVCLYHLGLYVPLSKLREHQWKASGSGLTLEHWTRIWVALRLGHSTNWARADNCPKASNYGKGRTPY